MANKLPLTVIILAHRNDQRLRNAVTSAQFAEQVLIVKTKKNTELTKIPSAKNIDTLNMQLKTGSSS
jgi:hypothetical protein